MAGASRRGYGEDGIYFDHRDDCRDSAHKTCNGRWRGVVSLGYAADGKRIRKKVSGQTRTEVKDKLKALHSELDAGVRIVQGYTVEAAVAEWLAEGLPGRAAKTVEVYRDALRPVVTVIGRILTLEQAAALLEAAEDSRMHAYIVLCLLTGVRSEEARALTGTTWTWTRRRSRCGGRSAPTATPRRTGALDGGGVVAGTRPGVHHRGHAVRVAQPAAGLPPGHRGGRAGRPLGPQGDADLVRAW
jgi:integrase